MANNGFTCERLPWTQLPVLVDHTNCPGNVAQNPQRLLELLPFSVESGCFAGITYLVQRPALAQPEFLSPKQATNLTTRLTNGIQMASKQVGRVSHPFSPPI